MDLGFGLFHCKLRYSAACQLVWGLSGAEPTHSRHFPIRSWESLTILETAVDFLKEAIYQMSIHVHEVVLGSSTVWRVWAFGALRCHLVVHGFWAMSCPHA